MSGPWDRPSPDSDAEWPAEDAPARPADASRQPADPWTSSGDLWPSPGSEAANRWDDWSPTTALPDDYYYEPPTPTLSDPWAESWTDEAAARPPDRSEDVGSRAGTADVVEPPAPSWSPPPEPVDGGAPSVDEAPIAPPMARPIAPPPFEPWRPEDPIWTDAAIVEPTEPVDRDVESPSVETVEPAAAETDTVVVDRPPVAEVEVGEPEADGAEALHRPAWPAADAPAAPFQPEPATEPVAEVDPAGPVAAEPTGDGSAEPDAAGPVAGESLDPAGPRRRGWASGAGPGAHEVLGLDVPLRPANRDPLEWMPQPRRARADATAPTSDAAAAPDEVAAPPDDVAPPSSEATERDAAMGAPAEALAPGAGGGEGAPVTRDAEVEETRGDEPEISTARLVTDAEPPASQADSSTGRSWWRSIAPWVGGSERQEEPAAGAAAVEEPGTIADGADPTLGGDDDAATTGTAEAAPGVDRPYDARAGEHDPDVATATDRWAAWFAPARDAAPLAEPDASPAADDVGAAPAELTVAREEPNLESPHVDELEPAADDVERVSSEDDVERVSPEDDVERVSPEDDFAVTETAPFVQVDPELVVRDASAADDEFTATVVDEERPVAAPESGATWGDADASEARSQPGMADEVLDEESELEVIPPPGVTPAAPSTVPDWTSAGDGATAGGTDATFPAAAEPNATSMPEGASAPEGDEPYHPWATHEPASVVPAMPAVEPPSVPEGATTGWDESSRSAAADDEMRSPWATWDDEPPSSPASRDQAAVSSVPAAVASTPTGASSESDPPSLESTQVLPTTWEAPRPGREPSARPEATGSLEPEAGDIRTRLGIRDRELEDAEASPSTAEQAVPWLIGFILLLAGMVIVLLALIFAGDESLGAGAASPSPSIIFVGAPSSGSASASASAAPSTAAPSRSAAPTTSTAPTPTPLALPEYGPLEMTYQGRSAALAPIYLLRHDFTTAEAPAVLAQDPALDVRRFAWEPAGTLGVGLLSDVLVSIEPGQTKRRLEDGISTVAFGDTPDIVYAVRVTQDGTTDTATVLAIEIASGDSSEVARVSYDRPASGDRAALAEAQFADDGGPVRLFWTHDDQLALWVENAGAWVMPPGGGEATPTDGEHPILWSPDGRDRITLSWDDGTTIIQLTDADGEVTARTSAVGLVSHIRWAPSGDRIVFTLGRSASGGGILQDLFLWDLGDGETPMQLTSTGAAFGAEWLGSQPRWTP